MHTFRVHYDIIFDTKRLAAERRKVTVTAEVSPGLESDVHFRHQCRYLGWNFSSEI